MESALAFAEAALARGDYSQCLNALEKLSEKHSLNTPEGSKIRMLMVTAWMGKAIKNFDRKLDVLARTTNNLCFKSKYAVFTLLCSTVIFSVASNFARFDFAFLFIFVFFCCIVYKIT